MTSYDCPACKAPESITIVELADQRLQQFAVDMMGAPVRRIVCSACDRDGRLMPGMNDQEGLRLFAHCFADDAGLGMESGKRYRIVWRGEMHRKDHESVVDFLGRAKGTPVALNFSGSTMILANDIKSVSAVPQSSRIVLDRVVS
ncbi:MAG TPA: hypothetical protein VGJ60_07310 [Chloroflexota bacterium]|jgi:hypothetical protein